MCGRFSLTTEEQRLNEFFTLAGGEAPYVPRYNGAPTQQLAVITNDAPQKLSYYRWGLIPFWAKEVPKSAPVINARAESLTEKPMFRNLLRKNRCLVPADGFFEWARTGAKVPFRFTMKDNAPFAMAGLWDEWKNPEGHLTRSFTIITTGPNTLMEPVHDRMPVIIDKADYSNWLSTAAEPDYDKLLLPFDALRMKCYRVSDRVNSVRNNDATLIIPLDNPPDLFQNE